MSVNCKQTAAYFKRRKFFKNLAFFLVLSNDQIEFLDKIKDAHIFRENTEIA